MDSRRSIPDAYRDVWKRGEIEQWSYRNRCSRVWNRRDPVFIRPFTSFRRSAPMTRHEVNLASAAASTDRSLTAPVSETPEPATPPTAVLAGKHEAGFATNAEPLSAEERRARAAALRGMLLARQRRFGPARRAFAEAIKHDPALDLASVPTFLAPRTREDKRPPSPPTEITGGSERPRCSPRECDRYFARGWCRVNALVRMVPRREVRRVSSKRDQGANGAPVALSESAMVSSCG